MTKFDPSTRLLARQALREAVRGWPDERGDLEVERAQEERISREIEADLAEAAARASSASRASRDPRAPREGLPSFARLLLGVLAMAVGVGLAWAASARWRRA